MLKYSYFLLICVLTAVDVILLLVCLKHRRKKAVNSFIAVMLLIIIAHVFYGASLVISQPEIKFMVHEMKFIGVVYFSVAFFIMYMQFFDKRNMLRKRNIILLSIVPTISLILALTNNYHHLFRERLYLVENDYGSFVGVQSGLLFWPYIIYSYSIYVFVICIVIRTYLKTPKIYRLQLGIMVAAAISTLLINFVSVSGIFFEDFGDATLISFTFAAIIQFYGLVLYKPAGMIKMARGLAVNEIKDPLIAFDYNNRFLDANIAAYSLFNLDAGFTREMFLTDQLGLSELDSDMNEGTVERGGSLYNFKVRKVYDEDGVFAVTVVSVSDITEMMQREHELESIANYDYLTGIANRHSYQNELKRLRDDDLPVAVVHFNISGMKAINRMHGNEAGDAVIKRVASVLADAGSSGFCARLGGDEFALLLRRTAKDAALAAIAEIENNLTDIRLVSGLAVKNSNLDNINIIDKLSMDNMYMNKHIKQSMTRKEW